MKFELIETRKGEIEMRNRKLTNELTPDMEVMRRVVRGEIDVDDFTDDPQLKFTLKIMKAIIEVDLMCMAEEEKMNIVGE